MPNRPSAGTFTVISRQSPPDQAKGTDCTEGVVALGSSHSILPSPPPAALTRMLTTAGPSPATDTPRNGLSLLPVMVRMPSFTVASHPRATQPCNGPTGTALPLAFAAFPAAFGS